MSLMNALPLRELYWAAGFLEGEGSFLYTSGLRVQAAQVNIEPLMRLRRTLGGRIYLQRQAGQSTRTRWASCSVWVLHGVAAGGLMMTLYGLMSAKRQEQIRRALAVWRSKPGARALRRACLQGHLYTPENTWRGGRGERVCKACARQKRKAWETRRTIANQAKALPLYG